MNKRSVLIGMLSAVLILGSSTGCGIGKTSLLPEKIVANAMEANKKPQSYYMESKSTTYENGKLSEESTIKQWNDASGEKCKVRVEVISKVDGKTHDAISVNNGEKIIVYSKTDKQAMTSKVLTPINNTSPKEQSTRILEAIKKTHDIKNIGEEEINGFKTLHIKAIPRNKNTLFGEIDFWIDKKTWFTIKSIALSGNIKSESICTKLDFETNFTPEMFKIDIPSDIKIINLDESSTKEKDISFEDAQKNIGKPILSLKEESGYTLKSMKLSGEGTKYSEIVQEYQKNNKPSFTLSMGRYVKTNDDDKIPGEEEIKVRGQKGSLITDGITIICWSENGVRYSFIVNDPNIKVEEAKNIINMLELKKVK